MVGNKQKICNFRFRTFKAHRKEANFEHYLGQDSKYKDLFYGWDVVNEAVSDNGGYRTEKENPAEDLNNDTHGKNSSWWAVYQSNEYIINAFKYANK